MRSCHRFRRNAPNMSAKVGVFFVVYHGRSRRTCLPLLPTAAYHTTLALNTNHDIGCARSTLRAQRTCGSCKPTNCLLSWNATSILQRRQYPLTTNSALTSALVANSASSRHTPLGSRTSTSVTGSVLLPAYHSTFRTTCTRNRRLWLANSIVL